MDTLRLHYARDGYQLIHEGTRQRPLRVDFSSARLRHRLRFGGKELLLGATSAKSGMVVVDCTAGLGTDAFLLASRGCFVTLIERSHTLFLMLEDALERAGADPAVSAIASRMTLVRGDAIKFLGELDQIPDVIVIDPMFPERRKRAEVRGELQVLQRLLGKDESIEPLVFAARNTLCTRVVVKRPLVGGEIAGLRASHRLLGKASRFDVFQR